MKDKIDITLSEEQMELLLKHVRIYITDEDIEKDISSAIPKDNLFVLSMTPDEIDILLGSIYFVCNRDETNKKLVEELDELTDLLESYLDAL